METSRVAALAIFAGLPEADIAAIAEVAFELEVVPGEELATEGDLGHALFAIETGTADVVTGNTTLRTIGPGDLTGEVAVLAGGRRTASIVATSPMRLLGVFKRDVWALDRKAPDAAGRLRAALEEHTASAPPR
jgi:CPA1 family monovalent cation:H+ antiporter